MTGRLSSRMRYTPGDARAAMTPSAVPLRWRRTTHATNPMIASVVMRMSSGVVSGKNMSQNESSRPPGGTRTSCRSCTWLTRNGPTHNADSSTR